MFRFSRPLRSTAVLMLAASLGGFVAGCASESDAAVEERMAARVHERIEATLDDIDATAEQRKKVDGLEQRLLEELKTLRSEGSQAHEQALELWLADKADAAKAHELADQRIDAMRDKVHTFVDLAIELHGVLTPEQRKALADRVEERRARWGHAH